MRQLIEREQWFLYGVAAGVWAMWIAKIIDHRFFRTTVILTSKPDFLARKTRGGAEATHGDASRTQPDPSQGAPVLRGAPICPGCWMVRPTHSYSECPEWAEFDRIVAKSRA